VVQVVCECGGSRLDLPLGSADPGNALHLKLIKNHGFECPQSGSMIERVPAGPCGGDLIRRDETDESRLVIYYHGGGFFFGSSRSHRVIATHLARTSGAVVLAADYRLAPEYPAPTAHDDAFAVYKWALAQGYDPASIALTGDSAGGNLALSVAVRAKKEGLPQPGALVLMSPALDLASVGDSIIQ
jgi:monoterpene epsilon-lactone hydrolase